MMKSTSHFKSTYTFQQLFFLCNSTRAYQCNFRVDELPTTSKCCSFVSNSSLLNTPLELVRHGSQVATVHQTPFPISPQNLVHYDDVTVVCNWQEERLRRGDDLRLQMAIEESKREKAKPEEVCDCV